MYLAVVQFNPKTGALRENCERALEMIDELAALSYPPDLVVFPAFALSGAELGGLTMHNAFAAEALDVAQHFMEKASLPTLIGTVLPRPALASTRFICEEEVLFAMGGKGTTLGFLDLENSAELQDYVESIQIKLGGLSVTVVLDDFIDPEAHYNDSDVIISLLARPFQETNGLLTASSQIDSLRSDAQSNNAWVVVANLCGGEDCYVYEGASLVIAPNGGVVESAPAFEEAVFTVNLTMQPEEELNGLKSVSDITEKTNSENATAALSSELRKLDVKKIRPLLPYEAIWKALCVGLRDYVLKNGFTDVVLGLSGGIDSAVVATLAVDALGAEKVHGILMPSECSSPSSITDAEALAHNLGIATLEYDIKSLNEAFLEKSQSVIGSTGSNLAIQNVQARLRMTVLMHLSNSYNWLMLNTGNKSEAAVGYSTLYGDTAGALAPLGGIYKTDVYGLAEWRNSRELIIPQAILEKEPSAELYPDQKDSDSLPPYEVLDQILRLHIDENLGVDEIMEFINNYPIETSITSDLVLEVLAKVKNSEFKRRQEPWCFQFDSINITEHRAWPLTNGFNDHCRDIVAPTEILNYLSSMRNQVGNSGFNFTDN